MPEMVITVGRRWPPLRDPVITRVPQCCDYPHPRVIRAFPNHNYIECNLCGTTLVSIGWNQEGDQERG